MAVPYFVADSASVTVLRALASTAFGKYNLTLPDGVDLEDVYEVSAEGNELAYVASLGARRRVGGMFRRFVRADVNVTAEGEDMVPASDVERVLNDAEKRVSGDFFLESDITRAGLGPWKPFVDFHVGDIANVEIWGRVVSLVVTRIEPKRTEHSDNDWSVHVGGQLLSDAEARLAENAEIYNAVVSDRRDLAGLDGKIRTETNNRKAAVRAERDARVEEIGAEREARTAEDEALSKRIDALPTSETLNGEIVELNERIRALGGESSRARDALMEKLRLELQELGGEQAEARRALQRELGEQITALGGEQAEARRNLQRELGEQIRALSSDEAEARSLLQKGLQQQIERMGGAQDEARRRDMKSLNDQISGLNTDLTLLKQTEINDLQGKWNAQQEEINAQNAKYQALQGKWNAQQEEINDQNAKYQALQGEWNRQQSEINDQNAKYQNLQNELNTQQGKINDQNRDFRDLQTVINDKQTGINALNTRFQKEQKKVNDLNDEFRAEQQKVNAIDRKALDALDETVKLQHLNNHGSWYINGSLPARSANYMMNLPYDAPRVTPVGCRQFQRNGASYIEFLEPGDWRVDLKFLTPLRTTLAREYTGHLYLFLGDDAHKVVDTRRGMYNCMGFETVMLHATFHVPKAGYTISAGYKMDKDSSLFQADNGPEYTELSVRQLSRVDT